MGTAFAAGALAAQATLSEAKAGEGRYAAARRAYASVGPVDAAFPDAAACSLACGDTGRALARRARAHGGTGPLRWRRSARPAAGAGTDSETHAAESGGR